MSILGSMLIDKTAVNRVFEIIGERSEEDSPFYRNAHTLIYLAMSTLDGRSEEIDLLSVTSQLRIDGTLERVGGAVYLVDLTSRIVTTANVAEHSRIILDLYINRELIRKGEEMKLRAFTGEESGAEILDDVSGELLTLSEMGQKRTVQTAGAVVEATLATLDAIDGKQAGLIGISSGLIDLDSLTGGWVKSNLIILAARPGQGKSALSLRWGMVAAPTTPVALFSLEMSSGEIGMRMICAQAKVSLERARKGMLTPEEWRRIPSATKAIAAMKIFIDDTAALSLMELRAKCRRLKAQQNIGMVIIDYLQLMHGPKSESREQEISKISRGLKSLAKDLDIVVIALSQLNREVERRTDKRPLLSDLRESGAIEQDADLVVFVYRPETYGITTLEHNGTQIDSTGIAEIILAKQRNGRTDDVRAKFQAYNVSFDNFISLPNFPPVGDSGYGKPAF